MEKLRPQLLRSLEDYSREKLMKDLIAGVIVAIIALPLSIALALASGVSPEQGLYTPPSWRAFWCPPWAGARYRSPGPQRPSPLS